jgi:hypothetical protein
MNSELKSADTNSAEKDVERFVQSIMNFLMVQALLEKVALPVVGKIGNLIIRKGATAYFWNTWTKKFSTEDLEQAFGKTGDELEEILGTSVNGGSIDSSVVFSALVRNPKFTDTAVEVLGLAEVEASGVKSATSALETVTKIFSGASDFFDPVQYVLLVVLIVGMIFDALDPCNTDGQMSYDQFNIFGKKFNDNFRQTVLMSIGSNYDSFGNLEFSKWPLRYSPTANGGVLDMYKNYEDPEKRLEAALMAYYLDNLSTNAEGEPINWNPNYVRNKNGMISGARKAIDTLAIKFANNNRVVAIGIERFWPLILLGFIILIIIILVLINEQ